MPIQSPPLGGALGPTEQRIDGQEHGGRRGVPFPGRHRNRKGLGGGPPSQVFSAVAAHWEYLGRSENTAHSGLLGPSPDHSPSPGLPHKQLLSDGMSQGRPR